MPTMLITHHAVDQFISRCAPEMGFFAARRHLIDQAPRAARMRAHTPKGQAQWHISNPDAVLVTKDDPNCGTVCVTVLRPNVQPDASELVAAYEAWRTEREADVFPALQERAAAISPRPAAPSAPVVVDTSPMDADRWSIFEIPGGLATATQRAEYRRLVVAEYKRLHSIAKAALTAAEEHDRGDDPVAAVAVLEAHLERVLRAFSPWCPDQVTGIRNKVAKTRRRLSNLVHREQRASLNEWTQ